MMSRGLNKTSTLHDFMFYFVLHDSNLKDPFVDFRRSLNLSEHLACSSPSSLESDGVKSASS